LRGRGRKKEKWRREARFADKGKEKGGRPYVEGKEPLPPWLRKRGIGGGSTEVLFSWRHERGRSWFLRRKRKGERHVF